MKYLRYAALAPAMLALLSLLPRSVATHLVGRSALMDGSTAFGILCLAITWAIYFSNYRYRHQILLAQGLLSLPLTLLIVAGYIWNIKYPLMHVLVPVNSPFMLNLAIVFSAVYLIQILYRWLPRTTFLINVLLAVIFFITTLSVSGHIYRLDQIVTARLLMPIQPMAIICFLLLSATIFMHANHKKHLYLNKKIMVSFFLMFVAIVLANVVVYKNFNRTVRLADKVNTTREILSSVYEADLHLNSAVTDAQAYQVTDGPQALASYQKNKAAYFATVRQIESQTSPVESTYRPIQQMVQLGQQMLLASDNLIAQTQQHANSVVARSASSKQLDAYTDQLYEATKVVTTDYRTQLNDMFQQEAYGGQGIVTGVSVTSALSVLLIIFTPLFIRQTIEKLTLTQDRLSKSYRQLFEEGSRVEAMLANMADGIFAVDAAGLVTTFNPAAERLTGLSAAAVIGKPYGEVLHFTASQGESQTPLDFVAKALAGKSIELTHRVTLEHRNGHLLDIQLSASPVRSHRDGIAGAIVVFRDRTSEQALENAKDDFVSLASHQLRTPATATKQFLAMFLQGYAGPIDDRQRMFLQQAYDNNELGIAIIEDLLNATRLESNRLKVEKEKIELTHFLKQTAEQHQPLAKRNGQTIKVEAPRKHVYIESDVSLLGMAVDNLVTNALKYSAENSTVTIRLTDGARIAIAVSDTGIGIQKSDIPKIFGRFSRLEDPQKQHVSGTGIGLYLVRRIVQVLHAKIKVESTYGKGSTFVMEFKSAG
jgi:PAS domain S-box-containing protein